jgi:proline racemase
VGRRTFFVVAGWLAAAVVATLIGLGAIRLVGDSIASTPGGVRTQAEVAREFAVAPPTTAPATQSPTATPTPTPAAAERKTFTNPGGTVIARCAGARVELVTATPAQGYEVTKYEPGEAEVRFEGPGGRFELKLTCQAGVPVARGD